MENNNQNVQSRSSAYLFFRIVLKNIWLIILLTVLGVCVGIGLGRYRVKLTYTAKCAVMLATSLDPSSQTSHNASTDVSHAKIYLPTVKTTVTAPITINKANSIYAGGDGISSGRIRVSVDLNRGTCIFAISYSDSNPTSAKDKLESIIAAADMVLNEEPVLSAGEANLIPLQSEYTVTASRSISTYVLLGFVVGFGASAIFVVLKYAFDNKVKDAEELEELSGTDILTLIEK